MGIEPANVNRDLWLACAGDANTYALLHSTIDLDGLYDLIEMADANRSWQWAATENARGGAS